jgi:diaminohydroxyphosphoribosylaminopyrimidine deaminase/5-amino-6-(5-phosphoribosylamino)uracil reductase
MPQPTDEDRHWMKLALEIARLCPPKLSAYSVGAVIVDQRGHEISRGYSREIDDTVHAEESALSKLAEDDPRLKKATIYSTLEPCSERKSRPLSCTQLILNADIPRVVMAWREPSLFVADCQGYELLASAGVTVVELPEFAEQARAVNSHLPLKPEIAREMSDPKEEALAFWNWGEALADLGRIAEAIPLMEVLVAFERQIGHPDSDRHSERLEQLRRQLSRIDRAPGSASPR